MVYYYNFYMFLSAYNFLCLFVNVNIGYLIFILRYKHEALIYKMNSS